MVHTANTKSNEIITTLISRIHIIIIETRPGEVKWVDRQPPSDESCCVLNKWLILI